MHAYKKSILIVLSVFVLLFAGSGYLNGYRLKKSLQRAINPYLLTDLKIGGAYINSFTGNGYLSNIRLPNPPGFIGANAFRIERIDIKGGPTSLHGETITLDQLHIQNIEVYILQTKQGNNFAKLYNHSRAAGDYGIKKIELERFQLDPVKIYLGPKVMNQNPFSFSLQAIDLGQEELEGQPLRKFGRQLAALYLDQLEALHKAGQIPIRQTGSPWVSQAISRARKYLQYYQ